MRCVYSFIVFKYVNLIPRKEKCILGRIRLYFRGFIIQDTFREMRIFLGIWGDQGIIFREQVSTVFYVPVTNI